MAGRRVLPMLNPALDLTGVAARLAEPGRVLIPDFLEPAFAARLHRCLETEVPWGLTYVDRPGAAPALLQAAALAQLTPAEREAIRRRAQTCAEGAFAFHYSTYMMISAYRERRDPGLALHPVVEFLNSPPFLGLMTRISGLGGLVRINAQATRYLPGDFLTAHTDDTNPARRLAYVINLTRDWDEAWGGVLRFETETGELVESFVPRFNSLSLFRVPRWHRVSEVTQAATHGRYAITGWVLVAA